MPLRCGFINGCLIYSSRIFASADNAQGPHQWSVAAAHMVLAAASGGFFPYIDPQIKLFGPGGGQICEKVPNRFLSFERNRKGPGTRKCLRIKCLRKFLKESIVTKTFARGEP